MSHPHRLYRLLVSILVVSMLLGPAAQMPVTSAAADARVPTVQLSASGVYRTRVVVDSPARRARLEALGVSVLSEGPDWAVVLADAGQLESLARLRFEPRASDDLAALTAAAGPEKAWLAASLRPLLAAAEAVQEQQAVAGSAGAASRGRRCRRGRTGRCDGAAGRDDGDHSRAGCRDHRAPQQ